MIPLILAAVAGGLIVFLLGLAIYYRSDAKFWRIETASARAQRDEAVTLSSRALEAKQNTEDGFTKAKQFYDERSKLPLRAVVTDEQCENMAKFIAGKVVGATRLNETIQ